MRPQIRAAAVCLLGALASAARPPGALADVDASGIFDTTGLYTPLSIQQSGTTLTACAQLGGPEATRFASGTIDPQTGAFALIATPTFPIQVGNEYICSITYNGTFAPDGSSFTAQVDVQSTCVPPPFTCQPGCHSNPTFTVTGTRISTTPAPCCGNGVVDPTEQCDDGGTANGDCCSSTCQYEPPSTTCNDGNICTVGEQCNGAGVCGGFTSCRTDTPCNVCGLKCKLQAGACKCG